MTTKHLLRWRSCFLAVAVGFAPGACATRIHCDATPPGRSTPRTYALRNDHAPPSETSLEIQSAIARGATRAFADLGMTRARGPLADVTATTSLGRTIRYRLEGDTTGPGTKQQRWDIQVTLFDASQLEVGRGWTAIWSDEGPLPDQAEQAAAEIVGQCLAAPAGVARHHVTVRTGAAAR